MLLPKTDKPLSYMPQLDALRALAVSMVICSHWTGYHNNAWIDTFWFNGEIGVQLFFVLSGFLITGILLDEREISNEHNLPVKGVLKAFYIRRFLRIFPLFYATLFITYLLGHPDVRQSIQWHIPYLSNLYFALRGHYVGDVSHFWSLAVEEQFYIVWPFFMLLLPKKYLLPFMIAVVFVGPLFRFIAPYYLGWNDVVVNVVPFSSMDTLGIGALMALLQRGDYYNINDKSFFSALPFISIVAVIIYTLLHTVVPVRNGYEFLDGFVIRSMLAPALAGIVWLCINRVKGFMGKVLEFPPLLYLGKISYGIYILHFFIPGATTRVLAKVGITINVYAMLVLNIVVLVALCSISWFFFEKKINNLKRLFPYVRPEKIKPVYQQS